MILKYKTLIDLDIDSNIYKYDGTILLPSESTKTKTSSWTEVTNNQPTSLSEEMHKIEQIPILPAELAQFYNNATAKLLNYSQRYACSPNFP